MTRRTSNRISALDEIPALVAQLKQLTNDNPEQQRRWPVLEQQIGVKLAELKQTLDARARDGAEAARRIVKTDVGFNAMAGINGIVDAAIATERDLLHTRLEAAATYASEGRLAPSHGRLDPGVALLVKPFTQSNLLEKMRQLLGR